MIAGRVVVAVVAVVGLVLAGGDPVSAQQVSEAAASPRQVLTLREAVETSLEANPGLVEARWGLAAARSQVREAWGSVMPRVNFNGSFTRNLEVPTQFFPAIFFDENAEPGELVPVRFTPENQWWAQARADQPLFNAAAFLGVGAADRYETLQQEVLRSQAQQTATQARLRYYDVLLAQEQVRLTSNSVRRVEQVLEETRALYRAGLTSEYDVLRLEVELANLQPNLTRARNNISASRRALAVVMGVDGMDDVELAGSLLTLELPRLPGRDVITVAAELEPRAAARPAGGADRPLRLDRELAPEAMEVTEVLQVAARSRSDLRQLGLMRSLRETERRVEMSQYLPRISVFGTWTAVGQGDGSPSFFGEQRATSSAVGIEVSVPLFSGLQRPARVGRMAAVVEQVEAQLDYARDQADSEVRTLLDQAREAYDRALVQRRAVDQARRGYDIARAEYRAGSGSQLQVTDAELALRQSEFNYAQAVYDYITAQALLDVAVGVVPLVDGGDVVALQR